MISKSFYETTSPKVSTPAATENNFSIYVHKFILQCVPAAPIPRPYHRQQDERDNHPCVHAVVWLAVRVSGVRATSPARPHTGAWPAPAGGNARPQLDSETTRRSWALEKTSSSAAGCISPSCCASRRYCLSAESRFGAERGS